MGNWHCIPESCARVVYREYLPPGIRYNDRGRGWAYVDGDRYTLDNQVGQSPNRYHAFGTYTSKNQAAGIVECDAIAYWRTSRSHFGSEVKSWQPIEPLDNFIRIQRKDRSKDANVRFISKKQYDERFMNETPFENIIQRRPTYSCYQGISQIGGHSFSVTDILRIDGEPDVCTLTIYKQDEIVWQADYPECPVVEQVPCRLADVSKEIKIEKLPYLERIEVVNYAYDVRWGALVDSDNYGFLLTKKQIPNECLNIYNNSVASTIPNDFFQVANTPENGYNSIAQICSAPGCLPPEYQVICDCQEKCPDGTCTVQCGDRFCCYDSNGIAVKSLDFNSVFPSGSANGGDI